MNSEQHQGQKSVQVPTSYQVVAAEVNRLLETATIDDILKILESELLFKKNQDFSWQVRSLDLPQK